MKLTHLHLPWTCCKWNKSMGRPFRWIFLVKPFWIKHHWVLPYVGVVVYSIDMQERLGPCWCIMTNIFMFYLFDNNSRGPYLDRTIWDSNYWLTNGLEVAEMRLTLFSLGPKANSKIINLIFRSGHPFPKFLSFKISFLPRLIEIGQHTCIYF